MSRIDQLRRQIARMSALNDAGHIKGEGVINMIRTLDRCNTEIASIEAAQTKA